MKTFKGFFILVVTLLTGGNIQGQVAMTDTKIRPQQNATTNQDSKPAVPRIIKEDEVVFVDEDSRIYVNKSLPIYLKFATTPNGKTHDLKSLKHPEDAEPFYLDTEGANYIRTKWAVDPETKNYAYPLREVEMELFADSKPPVVNAIFNANNTFNKSGVIYYGSDLEISLKGWDEQSGVKGSFWSLNGDEWVSGKTTFNERISGDYSFVYYSVDNVNNYSESTRKDFVFDNTAPASKLLKTKEGTYVFGPQTAMQFEITENHSGTKATYFKIGELKYIKVEKDQILPASLKDGEYTISYYSVDNVNNGEELNELKLYFDKVAPETTLSASKSYLDGNILYVSESSKISLTATDNKAGVKEIGFTTRGFDNATYTDAFSLENFHGLTSISYQAMDIVNNKEINKSQEVFVDSLRPSTEIEFLGDYFEVANRFYVNESTKVKLTGKDLNSGLAYTEFAGIGNDFKKYDEPFNLSQEGYFGMMYRSVDNVDNVEYSKSIDMYLDLKGPEVIYNFSNRAISLEQGIPVYPEGTRLFLGATDDQSGTNTISYQVNDQKAIHYSSPKTIDISEKKAFKKGETYIVQIITSDLVNNKTSQIIEFKIEG